MNQPDYRDKIMEAAPLADEATVKEHFAGFVRSFVEQARRERWLHLLLKRPSQIYSNSGKLRQHLDWTRCISFKEESQFKAKGVGVYYDFRGEPVLLTVAEAFIVGPERDGIFSVVPGNLAIYFFHEYEMVLCEV